MSDLTNAGIMGLVTAILVGVVTYNFTSHAWELDAIKHGVGEYYLDVNHEKQFRWKPGNNTEQRNDSE